MNESKPKSSITFKELRQKVKDLATPIDFNALIEAGILEKCGSWYRILKMDELPSHATAKICQIKSSKKGTLVKFRAPSKRVAKRLNQE